MTSLRRLLAGHCCALIEKVMPPSLRIWGEAIRIEVAEIEDDSRALVFALDSLVELVARGLAFHLLRFCGAIADHELFSPGGPSTMSYLDDWQATPRTVGLGCAVGATLLGIAFMTMGGAPMSYLGVNLGALAIGLLAIANLTIARIPFERWGGAMILGAGLTLVATALFGVEVVGIARWIKLGTLAVQPSLVLLPIMIVAYVRARGLAAMAGMITAAIALAIQPDRAMAAALAAGAVAVLVSRRDTASIGAAIAGIGGFAVTMARPDASAAMPFVDQIIYRSFDVHAVAGLAVIGGLALLLLPALVGMRFGKEVRATSFVFGVTWATIIAAAALGNYPTPVVGYSGGAVLGYVLSLAAMPKAAATPEICDTQLEGNAASSKRPDGTLMLGAA